MKKVMTMVLVMAMMFAMSVTSYAGIFTSEKVEEPKKIETRYQKLECFDLSDVLIGADSKVVRSGDRGVTELNGTIYNWDFEDGIMTVNVIDEDHERRIDVVMSMITNGDNVRAYATVNGGQESMIDVSEYIHIE